MSAELEAYKKRVDEQLQTLRHHIGRMGLQLDFSEPIPQPDPDEPLAELFVYLQLIQDNLEDLHRENRLHVERLERRVKERTAELEEQLDLVTAQGETIQELSTPVIRVWDEILVLPLVGVVDTRRAQQIVRGLLEAIVETASTVAIIDITGVPVVDTRVAHHLLKTIEAARLLGTEVLLSGVSTHNAQTLVGLGVDLSGVVTKGTLLASLRLAFEITGNRVVKE